jgi:hypothetical protein
MTIAVSMEKTMHPSFTVPEWCEHRKISRSMFYKHQAAGKGPRTYNVGTAVRISPEADAEWLREREAESARRETATA